VPIRLKWATSVVDSRLRVVSDHEALVGPAAEEPHNLGEILRVWLGAAHDLGAGDQCERDSFEPRPADPGPDGVQKEDGVRGNDELIAERKGFLEHGSGSRPGCRETAQLFELGAVECREDSSHVDREALERRGKGFEKDPIERVSPRAVGQHLARGGGHRPGDARQLGRADKTPAGVRKVDFQEGGNVDVEQGAVEVEQKRGDGGDLPRHSQRHGLLTVSEQIHNPSTSSG